MKHDKPSSTAGRAAGLRDIGVLLPPPARPITRPRVKYDTEISKRRGRRPMPIRFLRGSRRRRPGKGGAADGGTPPPHARCLAPASAMALLMRRYSAGACDWSRGKQRFNLARGIACQGEDLPRALARSWRREVGHVVGFARVDGRPGRAERAVLRMVQVGQQSQMAKLRIGEEVGIV
jgi:hypothetical protein